MKSYSERGYHRLSKSERRRADERSRCPRCPNYLTPNPETIRKRFQTWRKKERASRRIPSALWGAAVELCQDHSLNKVSRALRLNYYGLKKRVHETKDGGLDSDLGFVKLDLGAPLVSPPEWRVEMEAPNGAKMTFSLKGAPRDLDPVELSRPFWSQGR